MEVYAELDNVNKKKHERKPIANRASSSIENSMQNLSEFDQTIVGTLHPRA